MTPGSWRTCALVIGALGREGGRDVGRWGVTRPGRGAVLQFTTYLIRNCVLSSYFEEFRAFHLSDDERLLLIRFFIYISDMLYLDDVPYVPVQELNIANSPHPHVLKFLIGSSPADRETLASFFCTLRTCLGTRHPLDESSSPSSASLSPPRLSGC